MHINRSLFAVLGALAVGAGSLAGCAMSANGDAGAHIGHGKVSRSYELSKADHASPFDTTDDLSDPAFVPQPSPLLPGRASTGATGTTTAAALSTTRGTTFDFTYYVVSMRPARDPNETAIYDCDGAFLTNASNAWLDDATTQGTARFTGDDGVAHTINTGSGCWVTLPYSARWGLGVENQATGQPYSLRPFRSIAVDPDELTVGAWYYVKELDGVTMPSPAAGVVHDGCVRAVDVGPAINGRHIDFFSGYLSAYNALSKGSSTLGGKEQITLYGGADKCALHISRGY